MSPIDFAKYIRQKTRTDTTTFTDDEILTLANVIQEDMAKEIIKANEDLFGIELTRNLVADKRNYALADDILQLKIVMAKLDGTNWTDPPLKEYDNNDLRINTDEDSIINFFSDNEDYLPGYFIFGKELIILNDAAIIAVEDGLKMWAILYPTPLSSLTGEEDMSVRPSKISIGFPRQFHELWARKVIIEWKESQDTPVPLTLREQKFDEDFEKALNAVKNLNLDRSFQASEPYDDGQDY